MNHGAYDKVARADVRYPPNNCLLPIEYFAFLSTFIQGHYAVHVTKTRIAYLPGWSNFWR